jgi:hypothetical protein
MKFKIIQKHCSGCGIATKTNNYYEGDPLTSWCDDCFVDEDKLKEIQARMPFCQKPKKVKCKVVASLPFPK